MAKGVEVGPSTGAFHGLMDLGPERSEESEGWARLKLANDVLNRVVVTLEDGRGYELVVQFWALDKASNELRVDYTLVLLDPLEAEIGEWVKDLPQRVPEAHGRCRLGEGFGEASGWVFERGRWGWQRVE